MKAKVMPVLHPAAILRGRHGLEPAQVVYLKRMKGLVDGTWPGHEQLSYPSWSCTSPSLQDLCRFGERVYGAEDRTLACDIETAGEHLICVGLFHPTTDSYICVRFRLQGGAQYWGMSDLGEAIEWLDALLVDPDVPLIFHNGQAFDVPYLQGLGFEVGGYAGDTLLMQRYLYPEMPADLQFVANLYAAVPAWKWMKKAEEGEGK